MAVAPLVKKKIQIHLMLIFINQHMEKWKGEENSNTSHVNLYLAVPVFTTNTAKNSNTSHVNLYLSFPLRRRNKRGIQIHLMLIFILRAKIGIPQTLLFKYISC